MQALLIVGTIMQVAGSISAGNAQAKALTQQADMYVKQAQIYTSQIETDKIENQRQVALEKAATAQESLARTAKLQRIIGSTIAAGAAAGISTQYGTITRLNEENEFQSAAEEAIARSNSDNRIVSLNLNSAIEIQNSANAAGGSIFQANQTYAQAGQAKMQGYMNAASSLMSYGMGQMNRGSVPSGANYSSVTGSNGNAVSTFSNGNQIRWT